MNSRLSTGKVRARRLVPGSLCAFTGTHKNEGGGLRRENEDGGGAWSVHEVSGDKIVPIAALADVTVRRQAADAGRHEPEAPHRMEGMSAPGVYELHHAFTEPGPYQVGFKVAIDAKPGGEQIALELATVVAGGGGPWASLHGESNSLSTLAFAVLMVVMMALMF